MPNHVRNIVKMKGITALPLFTEKEDYDGKMVPAFDFNKIIPMPESLNVESGSVEDTAIEVAMRRIGRMERRFERGRVAPGMSDERHQTAIGICNKTEDELCELGLQYLSNQARYGATSWYDWCYKNWGTKWNAYENKQPGTDTIIFETAWAPPEPVIAQLAKMYPEAEIEHWWADEDTGSNDGYAKYSGGEAVEFIEYESCSHEAYATYVLCWGESECLYQDEHGNWCRRNCDECHGCD